MVNDEDLPLLYSWMDCGRRTHMVRKVVVVAARLSFLYFVPTKIPQLTYPCSLHIQQHFSSQFF
jgi:hypothetical protein